MATITKRLDDIEKAVNPQGEEEIVFVVIYDSTTGEALNGEPPEAARFVMYLPDNGRNDSMRNHRNATGRLKKAKR